MSDNQIPDLSDYPLKGGRFSASAYAKKQNYNSYTHKGITYWKTYEGKFSPGVTLDDALEKRRASQRRGGSREGSQRRKEATRQTRDARYKPLTKDQAAEVAKKTKEANIKGLDADHVFAKEIFSSGDINNPDFLQELDPNINRGIKRQDDIARSNYFLDKELKTPSLSMSTDELLDLVSDVKATSQAGSSYADTISRHIGQSQLDPEGMMRDFDLEFRTQEKARIHLRDEINNALNTPYDRNDPFTKGVWYGDDDVGDIWVKVSRELNTDSGTFANGKWTPEIDPTARAEIDILSDIGQSKGEYQDIRKLKNQFHNLKRTLPPGEYYMHADNPTKAKYYQRAFKDDPWIGPSGEQGGGRYTTKNKKGVYERYDTLKLTVPDEATQFQQAAEGPYPRWQDQGVPQLNKKASDIARRNEAQMLADRPALQAAAEASGGLKKALMKAGTVLPFVGAGLDAWDVTQRYEEMMNNPNEGFTDWLDKAQFSIASATLGTSFWAEPVNFALGLTNLGVDGLRTVFEKEKRDDFNLMMKGITRGIGHVATKLL